MTILGRRPVPSELIEYSLQNWSVVGSAFVELAVALKAMLSFSLQGLAIVAMHLLFFATGAAIFANELVPDCWTVPIVEPSSSARSGSQIATDLDSLSRDDREQQIEAEIRTGNVPDHWKRFVPVRITANLESRVQRVTVESCV